MTELVRSFLMDATILGSLCIISGIYFVLVETILAHEKAEVDNETWNWLFYSEGMLFDAMSKQVISQPSIRFMYGLVGVFAFGLGLYLI